MFLLILTEIGNHARRTLHNSTNSQRELGLIKHYSRLLFTNIDDDVTPDGCSCTGSFCIEKDWFGKDAIRNLYRKTKTITDTHYNNDEELRLDKSLQYSTNLRSTWPWLK